MASIDVFIPAYHPRELVEDCLKSVLSQTLPLRSVTLVDDASPYDLMALAPRYPSVRFVRNEQTQGIGGNLNRCLDLARAEFVTFLHSDDVMAPEWHAKWQSPLGKSSADTELFMSGSAYINAAGRVLSVLKVSEGGWTARYPDNVRRLWAARCYGVTFSGSLIYRRSFFQRMGRFPCERYPNNSDVYLNMAGLLTGGLAYVPDVLFYHRQHAGQSVCQTDVNAAQTVVGIFKDVQERFSDVICRHRVDLLREPLAVYQAIALYWLLRGDRYRFREYARIGDQGNPRGFWRVWTYWFFLKLLATYARRKSCAVSRQNPVARFHMPVAAEQS